MVNPRRTKYTVPDGDNIKLKIALNGRKNIRLEGVHTPEINTAAGKEAQKVLRNILKGKPITIDQVGTSYHRAVAVVRAGRKNVNNEMKRRGY